MTDRQHDVAVGCEKQIDNSSWSTAVVVGPSHSVKCYAEKESHGQYRIFYCPTEVGLFTITVTWNDDHVDGKYFTLSLFDRTSFTSTYIMTVGVTYIHTVHTYMYTYTRLYSTYSVYVCMYKRTILQDDKCFC